MAGTVVIAEEIYGTIKKIKFEWTSGTDAEINLADGQTLEAYSGKILGLCTVPDAVAAPTNLYDIALEDEDGVDVLMGGGADRSNVNTEYVLSASLGAVANDKLYLHVTNAGDTKKGTVYVFIR